MTKSNEKLWEEIEKVFDTMDINLCNMENPDDAYFEFWTDTAGQDCVYCVPHEGTPESFIETVKGIAENYDVDEELEIYLPMRGKQGVPSSAVTIMRDCEECQNTLKEISEALSKLLEK